MAEAIFAGKQVEEFTAREVSCILRLPLAVIPGLPKNLLMGDRPRNTRDRYRKDEQPRELEPDRRHGRSWMPRIKKGIRGSSPARNSAN